MDMGSSQTGTAVKAGIAYTIGDILIRGIHFLTLPVFSRLMTTAEFGVYNVFVSYESILFVIVGFALHSSLRSADIEFPGRIESYISSITLVYIGNLLLLAGIGICFSAGLSRLLSFDPILIPLLCVYAFSSAVLTLYNEKLALTYAYKKYLAMSFISSISNIGLSILLMLTLFRSDMAMGRIVGVTAAGLAVSIVIMAMQYRQHKPTLYHPFFRFGLKYSFPIIPHGISQVLLSQYDRIMIRNIIGDSAAGQFSLAANLKLVLTIITTAIATAWTTWFYDQARQNEHETIRGKAETILYLFLVLTVCVMMASPELILLLGGPKYSEARIVAVPIICDAFLLFAYNIIIPAEYYQKKTKFIMMGTILAALIDIVLNNTFIPVYGFAAAAYTTLFAYAVYLALHVVISRRVIGFHVIRLRTLGIALAVLTGMAVTALVFLETALIRYTVCAAILAGTLFICTRKGLIPEKWLRRFHS